MKKKTLIIFAIAFLLGSLNLNGQPRIGIKGGYSHPGFNAGVAVCFNLPYGFAVQPELQYVTKETKYNGDGGILTMKGQYIELPVGLQCGLDLILLRPFIALTPYVAYPIQTSEPIRELDYGLGVGGGLDIWRLQVNARYKWSFTDALPGYNVYNKGFEISMAFFF